MQQNTKDATQNEMNIWHLKVVCTQTFLIFPENKSTCINEFCDFLSSPHTTRDMYVYIIYLHTENGVFLDYISMCSKDDL
jgi:hypothetical protein